MNVVNIVFFTVLVVSSAIILYQDFKDRQVSVWLLLLFGITTISSVIYFRDLQTLFYNAIGSILYLGIIWAFLKLYLYLKFRKNKVILDQQLGAADVLIIFFIGLSFNAIGMVFFFCLSFIFSLLCFVILSFFKKQQDQANIPLAGFLVFFYVIWIIMLNLVSLNLMIDCSFIYYEPFVCIIARSETSAHYRASLGI